MANKFKVGDIIRGTVEGNDYYAITTEKMLKAEVIKLYEKDNEMMIRILEHEDETEVGEEYVVLNDSDIFHYYPNLLSINELEFGDILTLRNGERYIYAGGYLCGEDNDYDCDADIVVDGYNEDLTRKDTAYNYGEEPKSLDIVKVERANNKDIIYQRQDNHPVEMTVAEISEKLGYEVKIVKEK